MFDLFSDNLDFLNPFSVTVPQKWLVDALNAIGASIATRSTLPILSNVKMEAKDGVLKLMTTNLESCSIYRVPADVTQGAITVNYKGLLSLVKPLKGQVLTLSQDERTLQVQASGFSAPLETMPAEEFPAVPTVDKKNRIPLQTCTLPVETFRRLVNLVYPAASLDESRPVFTAIQVALKGDSLEMAAADSFRLHVARETVRGAGTWDFSLLIPAHDLHEIVKRLPKANDLRQVTNVTISTESSVHATISCGDLTVYTRLIEGNFPNYAFIIPQETKVNATVDMAGLKTAMQAVQGIAKDSANITRLHLNGALEVKAQRDGMKEPMVVHVDAKTSGQEVDILLNWRYLNEVLAINPGKEIQVGLSMPPSSSTEVFVPFGGRKAEVKPGDELITRKPMVVTFPSVAGFTGVIMPMHPNR